jgi:hypothetical protein
MGAWTLGAALFASTAWAVPGQVAAAQSPIIEAVAVRAYTPSPSSRNDAQIIVPAGAIELGGEMAFVTSDPFLTATPLNLTDLALFRVHSRIGAAEWLELELTNSLLAKQPAELSESIWQSTSVGARVPFEKNFAAGLSGAVGRLLHGDGYYWRAEPELVFKTKADRYLRFELDIDSRFTDIEYRPSTSKNFWVWDAGGGGEMDHQAALWTRIDYHIPVASNPGRGRPDPTRGFLDPQVRVDLEIGVVLNFAESGWDVYAAYTIVDSGELARPETTLPILDGGFDQRQLSIGVEHRFGPSTHRTVDPGYD